MSRRVYQVCIGATFRPGEAAVDQAEAVAVLLEKYEVVAALFHGLDYRTALAGSAKERLSLLPHAVEHIVGQRDGKERLAKGVTALSQAFALAMPHEQALALRDEVAFFQAVKGTLANEAGSGGSDGDDDNRRTARTGDDLDHAVRQLVAKAVAPAGGLSTKLWR